MVPELPESFWGISTKAPSGLKIIFDFTVSREEKAGQVNVEVFSVFLISRESKTKIGGSGWGFSILSCLILLVSISRFFSLTVVFSFLTAAGKGVGVGVTILVSICLTGIRVGVGVGTTLIELVTIASAEFKLRKKKMDKSVITNIFFTKTPFQYQAYYNSTQEELQINL